jgi:hypothetical protein
MWVQIAIWVAILIVGIALAPKPKVQTPAPGEPEGIATAEAGAPIAVLFGTRLIATPNVVWWGDVATKPIKTKAGKK